MKDSEFLENATLEGLLAAFANAKPLKNIGYVIESSYKEGSKNKAKLDDSVYQENNNLLNKFFKIPFKLVGKKHQFIIESDLDNDSFFELLYRKIQSYHADNNISDSQLEKAILSSFFYLRGSADFSRNYYSVDLPRIIASDLYLDKLFKLLTNIKDLRQLNLNFRELQHQFNEGIQRNTQLRINLRYIIDNTIENLKKINVFKYEIIKKNITEKHKLSEKYNADFIDRFIFYRENILNNSLTKEKINQLRKKINISNDPSDNEPGRNQSIVKLVREYYPERCAACDNDYPLENRTFKRRDSDKFYLEIHHCISFSADRSCDQIDNLTKLCPACHRALTKNRADEEYQKKLIQNILESDKNIKEFCLNFTTEENCIQFIYEKLS